MIETSAPSLGQRPQRTRNTAPVASAKRLTIFVIATSPTFCENEVLGRTPKRAANDDPIPSQITPPESSLSVASLPRPPSITPEISPTVSTAVTINIMITGMTALMSNTGLTGSMSGTANQATLATLSQFRTHAFVYSAPSGPIPVVGRTSPMMKAAMYPKMIPIRIDDALVNPLVQLLNTRITIRTKRASSRFSTEPKSGAFCPPPKVFIPTEIRLSPIERTTVPVTTDGRSLRRGLRNNPRTPSNSPPISEAPMIAPYAVTPPPMVAATLLNTPMKPDEVPIMIGTLPPIGPTANSCTSVTTPATIIAF